jgi:hypothetical protein
MLSQDAKRAPDARRLSRRSLLHGAATASAAGIAATALSAGPAMAATRQNAARQDGRGRHEAPEVDGSIMVHVRDARSGDIEVFYGDGKTRLYDQDLAGRIARAIRHQP